MSTPSHGDCIATIEIDPEAGIFHGRVIGTRTVLTFHGRTVQELKEAFAEIIAVYEDWCRERGKEPERPYSGSFTLRVPPELHKRIAHAAASAGKSINKFIGKTLEHAA